MEQQSSNHILITVYSIKLQIIQTIINLFLYEGEKHHIFREPDLVVGILNLERTRWNTFLVFFLLCSSSTTSAFFFDFHHFIPKTPPNNFPVVESEEQHRSTTVLAARFALSPKSDGEREELIFLAPEREGRYMKWRSMMWVRETSS